MTTVYLSIGSNIGDKKAYLQQAVAALRQSEEVSGLVQSRLYQTTPWGPIRQPDFYNAALRLETTLEPLELLDLCQSIEQQAGRVRQRHWGERTMDIDLLFYGEARLDTPRLTIPHPQMRKRLFVLRPLLDVAKGGLTALTEGWLKACPDQGQAEPILNADQW